MNTLQDSKTINSPESEMSAPNSAKRELANSLMGKEEFEQIAKKLKRKLSRASVTAKQLLTSTSATAQRLWPPDSPVSQTSLPKSSPLKSYYMWKRQGSSSRLPTLNSLPNLKSPDGRSPGLTKSAELLSSSPNRRDSEQHESPTKANRNRVASSGRSEPQMVLQALPTATNGQVKQGLNPLPVLDGKLLSNGTFLPQMGSQSQGMPPHNSASLTSASLGRRPPSLGAAISGKSSTTPTLSKNQMANQAFATPTQPGRSEGRSEGTLEEGADLLMYLATSPSPARPLGTTPRAVTAPSHHSVFSAWSKPSGAGSQFLAPQAPITPKKPLNGNDRTPHRRFSPSIGGLLGGNLPSEGVSLTPADFNMNDYINFFTPSPAMAATIHNGSMTGKNLMQTPNIPGLTLNSVSQPTSIDAKMINFDGTELFSKLEYAEDGSVPE